MNRRNFSQSVTAGAAAWVAALGGAAGVPHVLAQGGPVEGVHYVKLSQPAPVSAPTGKIEVVEFFWYGCPHCNALEPALEAWIKRLPADVAFRRVPVAFSATHESHQKLFYGLEAMGQLEAMHRRIFAAIHTQQQRLDREADQLAFLKAQGVTNLGMYVTKEDTLVRAVWAFTPAAGADPKVLLTAVDGYFATNGHTEVTGLPDGVLGRTLPAPAPSQGASFRGFYVASGVVLQIEAYGPDQAAAKEAFDKIVTDQTKKFPPAA